MITFNIEVIKTIRLPQNKPAFSIKEVVDIPDESEKESKLKDIKDVDFKVFVVGTSKQLYVLRVT